MKSIKKLIFVLAALTAVFGFVACSDDDDDGGSSAVVFVVTTNGVTVATATFDGGNFEVVNNAASVEMASGTYTGDPSKDGDITLKYAKMSGVTATKTETVTITNGKVNILGTVYTRK